MRLSRLLVIACGGAVSVAAYAQSVSVASFDSIDLRGGGNLVLRHGPVQQVKFLEGSPSVTKISTERDGRLVIRACETNCDNYRLRVEVVTPRIDDVAISGGGNVSVAGRFPMQDRFGAAVRGGGTMNVRAIPAKSISAAIQGGGTINTHAEQELNAAVQGGGTVTYWGNPRLHSAVIGGVVRSAEN